MGEYLKLAKDVVNQVGDGVQAEAIIIESLETAIDVNKGEVEQLSQSGSKGMGVRVIDGGKVGYAYTSDFSADGIAATVRAARELAEIATPDENRALPELQTISDEDLEIFDAGLPKVSTDDKVELARAAERLALEADKRMMVAQSHYGDSITHMHLANNKGFAGEFGRTVAYCYVMGTARDESLNDQAMGIGLSLSNYFDEVDAAQLAREAAYMSTLTLGGKSVPTQTAPVVFDPFVMAQLLGYLAFAMKADSLQRGLSFLIGKQGQDIASDKVSILDNGRMKRGMASAPFDGEGVPTSATRLVDEGSFQNVIADSYTARRTGDGAVSTGNAQRSSHRSLPQVGPSNFYLQPGYKSKEEIIAGVENGLYVTRIMQTGGINPINGDCSMAASGAWIKDGKLTDPINGVTVATTLPDLLKNISEVGSDLRILPFMGSIGAPTVRVENMTIGGTAE
jgi:PmbA protein